MGVEDRHKEAFFALPSEVRRKLPGGVWHATNPENVRGILRDGIKPGAVGYWASGVTRKLDCVSLFDFRQYDEDALAGTYEAWRGWISAELTGRRCAAWLNVDPSLLKGEIVSNGELFETARGTNDATKRGPEKVLHNPVYEVEIGFRGAVRPEAISGGFLICGVTPEVFQIAAGREALDAAALAFPTLCLKEWRDPKKPITKDEIAQMWASAED
jgi:hypothetical protein